MGRCRAYEKFTFYEEEWRSFNSNSSTLWQSMPSSIKKKKLFVTYMWQTSKQTFLLITPSILKLKPWEKKSTSFFAHRPSPPSKIEEPVKKHRARRVFTGQVIPTTSHYLLMALHQSKAHRKHTWSLPGSFQFLASSFNISQRPVHSTAGGKAGSRVKEGFLLPGLVRFLQNSQASSAAPANQLQPQKAWCRNSR